MLDRTVFDVSILTVLCAISAIIVVRYGKWLMSLILFGSSLVLVGVLGYVLNDIGSIVVPESALISISCCGIAITLISSLLYISVFVVENELKRLGYKNVDWRAIYRFIFVDGKPLEK